MEAINQRKSHHIAKMIRRNISELRKSGADIGKEANEVFDMIDDLAVELLKCTPPRNCDVGTPDEQSERFENFCLKHIGCAEETGGRHCVGCPLEKASMHITQKCELYWARMPYEADEKGDADDTNG